MRKALFAGGGVCVRDADCVRRGARDRSAIASIPGMTAIALSATLNTSHRTMPNIVLAAEEQADLIAYILSLK